MSTALTIFLALIEAITFAWLVGMIAPALKHTGLAVASAALMFLPAALLLFDAPMHQLGIVWDEEEGFFGFAFLLLPLGVGRLTLAVLNRARLQPFGSIEEY